MKKYKVNIDRQKPSSEEILSGRNFDELLKQYNAAPGTVIKKPFWKSGWFLGSMATVVVVVCGVFIYKGLPNTNNSKKSTSPNVQTNTVLISDSTNPINSSNSQIVSSKRRVAPPIKGLIIKNHSYNVSSTSGGTFTHLNGTKVTFPANAFVDENGNVVSGNVNIQYREFRNQVDFFLSGIPMQYDSAGQTYQFESAGMMEITGFINGKTVYLAKDKKVKVEFASKESGVKYNLYRFDTLAGNWNYLGKDKLTPVKKDSSIITNPNVNPFWEEHIPSPPSEPIKPVKVDLTKNRFTVAIDPKEFPEMQAYENMIFMVDEKTQKFDVKWYNVTWESIKLSYGNGLNKYKLALAKGNEVIMLDVYPALDEKSYAIALEKYNKEFADYSKKLGEYNAYLDFKSRQIITANYVQGNPTNQATANKLVNLIHVFEVSEFGIYNTDCPSSYPQGGIIVLNFKDDGKTYTEQFANLFLVDRNKKALYNYHYAQSLAGFHFNPKSSNIIWAVKDGKLFYADNDQLSKLPSVGSGTVSLKPVEKEFKTAEEMKAFFKIGQDL